VSLLLAQAAEPAKTLVQQLHQFVPFEEIARLLAQAHPAFVLVAVALLVIGYQMQAGAEGGPLPALKTTALLFAAMAVSPWAIDLCQSIVSGLIQALAKADPSLNVIIVNNPGDADMALNFGTPYHAIGQFIAGKLDSDKPAFWDLSKNADYLFRQLFILTVGAVAFIAVFIMEALLILQKLILIGSRPLVPVFIACLSLPVAKSSGEFFLKSLVAALCWPLGWAIVHAFTLTGIQTLQPPAWNAPLGTLLLAFLHLAVVCFWMVVGTIAAVKYTNKTVTSGANFASGVLGSMASASAQHAASGLKSGGAVAGGMAGFAAVGPVGVAAGSRAGGAVGGFASAPISSASQSAEGGTEAFHPLPSSRSAGVANAALKALAKVK
jgi:hypothetical protein